MAHQVSISDLTRITLEKGDYIDGLEFINELAEKDAALATRFFLLHRPSIYQSMKVWSESVMGSCELFLPSNLYRAAFPVLYQAIERFEMDYSELIQNTIKELPDKFKKQPVSGSNIKKAVLILKKDKELRRHLRCKDEERLREAQEIIVDMVKGALLKKGKKLKDYSSCELVRLSREVLPKNLHLLDIVNTAFKSRQDLEAL